MRIIEQFNPAEWKNISTIARHFRKKDGTLGVHRSYVKNLIALRQLELDGIEIDGQMYYHIPLEWQEKDNWNLNEIFEQAKKP